MRSNVLIPCKKNAIPTLQPLQSLTIVIPYARRQPGKHSYDPRTPLITTKGVRILVKFFDESKSWVPMEDLQPDNPILLIDYALKKILTSNHGWSWVKHYDSHTTQSLRTAFLTKFERTPKYKFGIHLPNSIKHAYLLDKLNGDNQWDTAMQAEMGQLDDHKTFRLPGPDDDLSQYQEIPYHMVFDVKFDG
jgi:hypothetical protein